MHQFHKFILSRNSTCFGHFLCPSSGVYLLYTQQFYEGKSISKLQIVTEKKRMGMTYKQHLFFNVMSIQI
jgi:hypothetical protein